jgi:hypothetical protein
MEEYFSRIKASLHIFDELNCCYSHLNGNVDDVNAALALVDLDKMRCHIINCLTALNLVEMEMRKQVHSDNGAINSDNEKCEFVKSKVFNKAITMIVDDEFDSRDEVVDDEFEFESRNEVVVNTIFSNFPRSISDERSWLHQHFAIAFSSSDKISEDDVRIILSEDPLAKHRLSKEQQDDKEGQDGDKVKAALTGGTAKHLPLSFDSLHDSDVCISFDDHGRCPLHLVAQYSESPVLLQDILQMQGFLHMQMWMTKMTFQMEDTDEEITPLGLLCRRVNFPSFDQMVLYLIEADTNVKVISNGITSCLSSYEGTCHDSPGKRGEEILILLRTLLDANSTVTEYDDSYIFHAACMHLRGEIGISVLSLFLSKDSKGVTAIRNGKLPIHWAARQSCLYVLKFLHMAYPKSISILETFSDGGYSLLHLAASDISSSTADIAAKVGYLCDQNRDPDCIRMKNHYGFTALHVVLTNQAKFNFDCVKILCYIDPTIVRDKCTPGNTNNLNSGRLPLHMFLQHWSPRSEVSDRGDCFRLLLRLYPAAAGITDEYPESPYNVAVSKMLPVYFIRMLLSADPTIDPERRHDLNFAARRQGMFLAFRALSSNIEPIIWAKMRLKGRDLLQHVISFL